MRSNNQHIMQVSELTKQVKFILESELRTVWLTGEISNLVTASSGHWYLSLKDAKSQVRCAMFKGSNRYCNIQPQNGMQVLVKANVSLYEPRGDFQLIIEQMESAGDGLLRQRFEQLKTQLSQRGFFDQAHKKPLPKFVETIGIVTSPTGAAIRDIISVLKRRQPSIRIVIYPALVQGESAANTIADMIALANERNECDLLIVGRGGGSMEDLWPFNEVVVVNAIHRSQLPVISAVGHEIDHTLADLVSDVRAPTPSAAAELVSQDKEQQSITILQVERQLLNRIKGVIRHQRLSNQALTHRLTLSHPQRQLTTQQQRLDDVNRRFNSLLDNCINQRKEDISTLSDRLSIQSPQRHISFWQDKLAIFDRALVNALKIQQKAKKEHFKHLIQQLNIVSPLSTISRGYAIVESERGKIVRSTTDVLQGEVITAKVADGVIYSQVINTEEKA